MNDENRLFCLKRMKNLMTRISGIEFSQDGSWDTFQHFLGEDTQQLPANVQRFEDGTVFIVTLEEK